MNSNSVISLPMNNKGIYLFLLAILSFYFSNAQITGTYQIKGADTVKIYKIGGSVNPNATELVLMNSSDTVPGFLFNTGVGITKFKRALTKINSTTYLIGADTLVVNSGGGSPGGNSNDIQFNQGGAFAGVDIFYYDSTKKTIVSGSSNTINTAATYSAVFGQSNTLTGINGFVVGTGNTIGVNSFAFGYNNNVSSYSISVGANNSKTSTYSGTIGQGLINNYQNSLLIGQYNDTTAWANAVNSTRQDTIPVFSIGNGSSDGARNNAFSILRNGNLRLNLKNDLSLDSALVVDQYGNVKQKFFTGGGGGGLTSVGLTMPGGLIVSNSPLSGSGGVIAVSTTLSGVIHGVSGAFTASQIVDADVANVSWSKIISTPTTVTGYGITNAVRNDITYSDPTWITALNWSKIINTPTTLAGYGITDPIVLTTGSYSNPSWITTLPWSKITSTPTTLAGYGITDATPSSRTLTINGTTFDLTANRTWTISTGPGTYAALTDVDLTSITNGQLVEWNSTTSQWNNFTPTYISGNQSITLSNDVTGSGTTSIPVTLVTVNSNIFGSNTPLKFSVNGKGLVTGAAALVAGDLNTIYGYTPINPNGTTSQYFRGDGSLATFPTIPAQFNPIAGTNITLSGTYPNITFNATGTGVTSFSAGNLGPLFTTSVTTATSTPALSFTLSSASAWTVFGNNTSGSAAGAYFNPVLASGLFNNQGTTTTVLHGNASGNPAWGAVNLATDMTGNIQIVNISGGTGASSATYLRGDNTWATLPVTVIPPNIGSALRVYSPQIPGFKSFNFINGVKGDTTTVANEISVYFDTTFNGGIHSQGYNDLRYARITPPDTIYVQPRGVSGLQIGYASGTDTINLKKLVAGTNITLTQNSDSSITIIASGGSGVDSAVVNGYAINQTIVGTTKYLSADSTLLVSKTYFAAHAGTVTSFSAGTLSPLFTTSVATSTSTPALTFALSNAPANSWFGNNTGSSAAPAYYTATQVTADLNIYTNTLQGLVPGNNNSFKTLHGSTRQWDFVDLTTDVSNILPVSQGGTGTATPGLVQGTNITITGTWPNQTINSSGSGTPDTIYVQPRGVSGFQIGYASGTDTISLKKLVPGTNMGIVAQSDSSLLLNATDSAVVFGALFTQSVVGTTKYINLSNQTANTLLGSNNSGVLSEISLTTTGTSGAATLTGTTLNIPQYTSGGGGGGTPAGTSGQVQINGQGVFTGKSTLIFDTVNSILSVGSSPTTLGTLQDQTFTGPSIPTGWSKNGSWIATYSNGLSYSGGTGFWHTNNIQYNSQRMAWEQSVTTITIVPGSKSAGDRFGITFNTNAVLYNNSPAMYWDLSNGVDSGRIFIGGDTTVSNTSCANSSWNVGDTLLLQIVRDGWYMEGSMLNKRTGQRTIYNTVKAGLQYWTGTGGQWQFAVLHGSAKILEIKTTSNTLRHKPLYFTDSEMFGVGVSQEQKRALNVLYGSRSKYNLIGLPSIRADSAYGFDPEIIADSPSIVVLNLGVNNRNQSIDTNTSRIQIDSVYEPLFRAGIPVAIMGLVPASSGATSDNWNTMLSNFSITKGIPFIDIRQILLNGGVYLWKGYDYDGIHYNDSGAIKIADTVEKQAGSYLLSPTDTISNTIMHNVGYARGDDNVDIMGIQADGRVVRTRLPIKNFVFNKYAPGGFGTIAQNNSEIHPQIVSLDSALLVYNLNQGLQVNFNGNTAATNNSNIDITNAGVNGVGFPGIMDAITGLRNIVMNGSTVKASAKNTISGNDNVLMHTIGTGFNISGSNNTLINTGSSVNALSSGSNNFFAGPFGGLTMTTGTGNIQIAPLNASGLASTNVNYSQVYGDITGSSNGGQLVAGDVIWNPYYYQFQQQFYLGGKSLGGAATITLNVPGNFTTSIPTKFQVKGAPGLTNNSPGFIDFDTYIRGIGNGNGVQNTIDTSMRVDSSLLHPVLINPIGVGAVPRIAGIRFQVHGSAYIDSALYLGQVPSMVGTPNFLMHSTTDSTTYQATGAQIQTMLTPSGTYTPTLGNSSNVASSSVGLCGWTRIGSQVHVWGRVTVTPTLITTATSFDLTLPIASALATADDASGQVSNNTSPALMGGIVADAVNAKVTFSFTSVGTSSYYLPFTFDYIVK